MVLDEGAGWYRGGLVKPMEERRPNSRSVATVPVKQQMHIINKVQLSLSVTQLKSTAGKGGIYGSHTVPTWRFLN